MAWTRVVAVVMQWSGEMRETFERLKDSLLAVYCLSLNLALVFTSRVILGRLFTLCLSFLIYKMGLLTLFFMG